VRIIACMDVRANDAGDLVCTKGDQYDVREKEGDGGGVRNLGKPVALAQKYYKQGADEITFLNITGFRDCPLSDTPMLALIEAASKHVFVPLTVGGGIRGFTDASGVTSSAVQVADAYFRAGADKVSIGSDAVDVAKAYLKSKTLDGTTSIEQIAYKYGRQAVVVSIDPRRRWVSSVAQANGHNLVDHAAYPNHGLRGPNGETLCWYECTVQGGRKGTDLDVVQLATAVEALGCGELLLNCIDNDGQNDGYDLPMTRSVRSAVGIPVIASSGAGKPQHFTDVFEVCAVEAALAASIFHRDVVSVGEVKAHLAASGVNVRPEGIAKRPMLLPTSTGGRALVGLAVLAAAVAVGIAVLRR